ncbi:MAG TPA: phosphatidylserine decarboxylase family protein [Kaistella sp.]|jgi:phosphatidylserine decarboxylase precursor-related protein|uniref:phosphatidylserine decarboxylase family protein n=1 Tax=Candidatus Kaistella beijingensis TaxID=2820270 RepID=UPI000EEE1A91|nr:phosphatidylserine decarboxylase family protein [Candidatus Kaistella beijingensis]MBN8622397.1 phosphatidylserine decarboxylase family protein [Flavobacteriales bacterium]MCA0391291.1 phosphatidylserine decarboxylase family protein [Bacteroidota bacterium]HCN12844.1 phosphatidylserine decarboxylase family protein [Chryseobacterium sp.]HMU06536.1 phosphatidylserine decarboxylase family protein [Kaistella sp.]UBB89147.1 phosphatidylserine decarboxylase family protein [Candidatus Kaistella be
MKLHKESKGTIIVASIIFAVVAFLSVHFLQNWSLLIIIPLLIIYGLVFWFFRVPNRDIQDHRENVIAPVDGKVVMIKEVDEDEFLKEKAIQVSIFMSPLNVHICRFPVSGKVIYKKYHPGKYLVAWHEKSSTENERTTVAVESLTNHKVVFRQIAGYVARRIVFYCKEGDQAKAGHEFGFIKFGSRMDVFLPLDTEIICKIGDKTKGGIDVIAKMKE